MMRATSESDVASIAQSSSSPATTAVYYVQSPSSRDSHDEADKCSSSSNCVSPLDSPSFPRRSMGSTASTAGSRISGSRISAPSSTTDSRISGNRISGNRRRWSRNYCRVVNEEDGRGGDGGGGGGEEEEEYGDGRWCRCLVYVIGFTLVFTAFCLVFWGVSRPYKPQISVKSLTVFNLYYGEGSDRTGVPTKLLTVNCSATMVIYNPARFFGIHVSSHPFNLVYSQVTIATGQFKRYYQPRKSKRILSVSLMGRAIPLYGTGSSLAASDESGGIPLVLDFEILSNGHLVGKLVNSKHTMHISCKLIISSKHTNEIIFEHNSCK